MIRIEKKHGSVKLNLELSWMLKSEQKKTLSNFVIKLSNNGKISKISTNYSYVTRLQ